MQVVRPTDPADKLQIPAKACSGAAAADLRPGPARTALRSIPDTPAAPMNLNAVVNGLLLGGLHTLIALGLSVVFGS